jgi:uncharacterized protein (DUF2252 family)
MRDPIQEFLQFNRPFAQRNPELLRLKVARMAESPFAFFRGTFHLFARDVLERDCVPLPLLSAGGAELDLVGDVHSENYGTFKAEDGAVHYDVNDFDETTRGRFDFDVCRLATSLFLAARDRHDRITEAVLIPLAALTTYADTVRRMLKKGRDLQLDVSDKSPAQCPPIDNLVQARAALRRTDFMARLTVKENGRRQIKRSVHYFNLPEEERTQALRLLEDYRKRHPERNGDPDFYRVEDVCGRVAGIGSMGRRRYAVLINGKGSDEGRNVLLEFKEARPSAYDTIRGRDTDAAALRSRAERVISVQRQSQAASSAHLGFALDEGLSFQAREIGPADERVSTKDLETPALLEGVARIQAAILARIHARAAARAVGPVNPLAELEDSDVFCQRILAFALAYADLVARDWTKFVGSRPEIEDVGQWAEKKG